MRQHQGKRSAPSRGEGRALPKAGPRAIHLRLSNGIAKVNGMN